MTFNNDSGDSTESLTAPTGKVTLDQKSPWSPLPAENTHRAAVVGTRYSHEEDSIAMSELNWKGTGHDPKSSS